MTAAKKLWRAWMHVSSIGLTLILLAGAIYYTYLSFTTDWDPYAPIIDSCLDEGGIWNDDTKECVHSS